MPAKVHRKESTLADGKDEYDCGDAEGEGENDDEGEEESREWLQKKKSRGGTATKTRTKLRPEGKRFRVSSIKTEKSGVLHSSNRENQSIRSPSSNRENQSRQQKDFIRWKIV